jgi:hypothetical protein
MESHQFDRLAKHLSRRGVTKGLLAGGVTGLLSAVLLKPVPDAAADKRGNHRAKRRGQVKAQRADSACARRCRELFPPGEERGKCMRQDCASCPEACRLSMVTFDGRNVCGDAENFPCAATCSATNPCSTGSGEECLVSFTLLSTGDTITFSALCGLDPGLAFCVPVHRNCPTTPP